MHDDYDERKMSIPRTMRLLMDFIDRIGFPILAFLLMFWLYVAGQKKDERRMSIDEQMISVMEQVKNQLIIANSLSTNRGR